jgi:uncharacterized membrane protein
MKNHLFVWLAVLTNTIGNFLLSVGMHQVQMSHTAYGLEYLRMFANPWIDAGVLLLIIWLASQLSLLSWADLSYVLPVTSASYVLTAILGHVFLHESVSLARWSGICAISIGVMLVMGTPPRARTASQESGA